MTIYKLCERGQITATFSSALTQKALEMKLHTAAILVILCLGIFTVHTVKGSAGSQSMRKAHCVDLHTKQLSIRNLVGYKRHTQANAVMFITRDGIKICVNADQKWVQNAMKKIKEKLTAKRK
ncbi:C-C motif chemokine 7-like [Empidonax traillii]|uniref:C-C motif chemokine 7-like n=1 Tax=Empidonax traillii TaxID=164674 RepID=UPI000FFD6035|nr:C-C motif chemokine 7-like [Empidonax traillii]